MADAYGGSAYPQEEDDELHSTSQTGGGGASGAVDSNSTSPIAYTQSQSAPQTPQTYGASNSAATDTSGSGSLPANAPSVGSSVAMPTPYTGGTTSSTSAIAPTDTTSYNTSTAGVTSASSPTPQAYQQSALAGATPMQAPAGAAVDPSLSAGLSAGGDLNPDGTLKTGIDSRTGLPFGNVAGYAPGGSQTTGAPQMYNTMTGQEDSNPADFAAITAYNQQQDAANGQQVSTTPYTDVPQIAGQNPATYLQQLSNANPAATAPQTAAMSALAAQSGNTVPAPSTNATPAPFNPATSSATPTTNTNPNNITATDTNGSVPANMPTIPAAPNVPGATGAIVPPATPSAQVSPAAGTAAGTIGTANVTGNNLLTDYQSQLSNLSQGNLAGAPGVDTNSILQGLLTGSNAVQGPTAQTQTAINNLLQNPSAYNSAAVQQTYDNLGSQIDDEYALQQQQLTNNMASRGLSDSSIAGGKLSDLNVGERSAKTQLAASLATQQAQDLSGATSNAINLGLTGSGQQQTASAQNYAQLLQALGFNQNNATTNTSQQDQILQQILGYGQQGFNNDTTTQQLNQQQQNEEDQLQLQLLGLA